MLKGWNHSITTRNYAVTYNPTLEEALWHLGVIKPKNDKKKWKRKTTKTARRTNFTTKFPKKL